MNDIEMGSPSSEKKSAGVIGAVAGEILKKVTGQPDSLIKKPEALLPKLRVREKTNKIVPDRKQAPEGPEKRIVYEAVAKPDRTSAALMPEDIQALREHIEGLAVERYKRPFKELPIHQRLELLGEQIRETGGDKNKMLQQSLQRLEKILQENPSPKQWQDLQETFAQMPNLFDLPVTEQSILFEVQNMVFSHVNKVENLKEYGLLPNDLDDVSEAIGWTGSGQRPGGPRARGAGRGGRGGPPPGPPPTPDPNREWDELRRGYDRVLAFDEEVERRFGALLPQERTEKINEVKEYLRGLLAGLEKTREDHPWSVNGISDEERSLATNLRLLQLVDSEAFEKMQREERVRNWLHMTKMAAIRGASPIDMDTFVKTVQELDDIHLIDSLIRMPGVWKAFQLLERNGVNIMASEHHPTRLKTIMDGIQTEMTQFFQTPGSNPEGMDPEAAIELAKRFWKVSGREGAFYRRYMMEKEMVHYGNRPDDDYIAADANLTWDLYRIIYYPHAIWKFFDVGGIPGGEKKVLRIMRRQRMFGSDTVQEEEATVGNGIGRDVRKVFFDEKMDFHIGDLFSRRLDYAFDSWLEQRTDTTFINSVADPVLRAQLTSDKAFFDAHTEQVIKQESNPRRRDQLREDLKRFKEQKKQEYFTNFTINKQGEFINSLENTPVEAFAFQGMRRAHEVVRSNVRDTKNAMAVMSTVWDFIQNPTPTNYFKLGGVTAYSSLANGQEGVYGPAYDALVKVNKGRLPLGTGINVGVADWNSIARKVYGWQNLEEWNLRQIRKEAIISGHLSKDQVNRLEGPFGRLSRLFDHGVDPILLTIVALGMIQGELEETAKQLKES